MARARDAPKTEGRRAEEPGTRRTVHVALSNPPRAPAGSNVAPRNGLFTDIWGETTNMVTMALNQAQNLERESQQEVVNTFIMG